MKIESLWIATTPSTDFPVLKTNIETDVIIVGGGIAGINAAYFLKNKGFKVIVIEATYVVTGTSGNTTAKVTSQHELKYYYLKNHFGKEKAQIYADSNQWAITELGKIITKEKIDCDFHNLPSYNYARTEKDLEDVKKETKTAKELHLPASFVNSVDSLPFNILGAIRFDNQAYFHPRKFLLSLANKINRDGSYIFEKTQALNIKEKNNHCEVITDKGNIKAKYAVVATNLPFYDKNGLFSNLYQMRSYVLGIKINNKMPEGTFIGPQIEDLSFRPHKSGKNEWLLIGGADHPAKEKVDAYAKYQELEQMASKLFDIKNIEFWWAAQDTIPQDKIPYIGFMPDSKRILVTTGFGEWGMTTSFVAAKVLTDLISGTKNDWTDLYDPARLTSSSKPSNRKPITETQEGGEFMDLKTNEGKVISQKGEPIAVYKDNSGKTHTVSAVCTHMGCTVGWNNKDKTWDCPCHGSRYDKNGKVIHGPAVKDLPKKELGK